MKSAYLTFGLTIVHLQSVFFLPISDQTTFCIVFAVGRDDSHEARPDSPSGQ